MPIWAVASCIMGVLLGGGFLFWCCCVVAGQSDDDLERWHMREQLRNEGREND